MQPDSVVLVRPDTRLVEEWVCLATRRASRPGWRVLAQRAGRYAEVPFRALRSRGELLDALRAEIEQDLGFRVRWAGNVLIPVNLSVVLPSVEPVLDWPDYVPMWPKRMPVCSTATEAMERMRITRGKDKEFARKFAGYRFIPVRIDDAVLVPRGSR